MTKDYKFIGECLIQTRWCDMDAYGHINNSKYFDYFSEARIIVLRPIMDPKQKKLLHMLVDTRCNFKKEIFHPTTLKFKHYVKGIGRTSYTLLVDIYNEDESVHHAQGEAKLVCYDPEKRKAVRIPDVLMQNFL